MSYSPFLNINFATEGVWESHLRPNLECISKRFVLKLIWIYENSLLLHCIAKNDGRLEEQY